MPVPRPKILTAVTVPTGGWDLQFQVSVAGSFDQVVTATVPAGTYYVAWDGQDDDLIYQLNLAMKTAIAAVPLSSAYYCAVHINSDNKVVISFIGSHYVDSAGYENDVRLQWPAGDEGLAEALGFDATADDTSQSTDRPAFTADYQHAYGWYANADGQLTSLLVEDVNRTATPQAVSLSGRVTSQNIGQRFTNEMRLEWLDREQTFSRGNGYTDAPVYPYARNVPLECWWEAARLGTQFRVYREGRNNTSPFVEVLVEDTGAVDEVSDGNKAWATDPQAFAGMVCHTPVGTAYGRFYISSNTATTLVSPNDSPFGYDWADATDVCYVLDHRYQTYVVDLSGMTEFAPGEHDGVDYYNITIPLLRYES